MWKGPIQDGITQSLLNEYLQCPYCAYLSLILGIEPPEEEPRFNLIWGDCLHVGLEWYIRTGDLKQATGHMLANLEQHPQIDHPDIDIRTSLHFMLKQYNLNFIERDINDWHTEVQFDTNNALPLRIPSYLPDNYRFRGKFDGISTGPDTTRKLLEHKCKGYIDPPQTALELEQDTQLNLYMAVSGAREVYYDLIRIPEAVSNYCFPTRLVREDKKEYTNKIYYGHCGKYKGLPINKYTQDWIHQGFHVFTDEDVESFWKMTFIPICHRLNEWYNYVTDPNFDIANPAHYNSIFYRHPIRTFMPSNTSSFKGKYHALTTGQQQLTDLIPKTLFNELKDE